MLELHQEPLALRELLLELAIALVELGGCEPEGTLQLIALVIGLNVRGLDARDELFELGRARRIDGPDLGSYSLLNPVPSTELRALAPGMTPFTVDAGHLQLEMGAANVLRDSTGGAMTTTTTLAALEIKVGLTASTDIELVLPAWVQRTEMSGATRGVGDPGVRAKINLAGNEGDGFAVAIQPHVTFPADNGLGRDGATLGAAVPIAFTTPLGFGVVASVDAYQPLSLDADTELASAALVSHPIAGPVTGFCEWIVGTTSAFDAAALTTHVGLNILVGEDGEVDTGVMVDPTDPTARYNPYVNLIVRR